MLQPGPNDAKRALAEDQVVLADGYSYEKRLENNQEKALHYYRKAADLGDERALFNVGAYYHRGEVVSKDPLKAEQFYIKSAELGYVDAHLRLGQLYLDGAFLAQDFAKAKHHFDEVVRLKNEDAKAGLFLGRWYCTAPVPDQDFSRCLTYLNDNSPAKRKDVSGLGSAFMSAVAAIFIEGQGLTVAQLEQLRDFVRESYQLNNDILSFSQLTSGVFSKTGQGYQHLTEKTVKQMTSLSNKYFGASFKVDIDGINRGVHRLALVSRWIERDANNHVVNVQYDLLYGSPRDNWSLTQPVKQTGANWSLEIFDLNRNLLHQEQFTDAVVLTPDTVPVSATVL